MFNWQPQEGQTIMTSYIWVYFVVTGGITILVVAIWRFWHRHTRDKQRKQLEEIEQALRDGETAINMHQISATPPYLAI
jgi:Na+/H+-translocating membrane pyrophosphatase